jgi:probable phosphoglycerate mutase
MAGVHLSKDGERQAEELAERLAAACIDRLYSSPMERARATAGFIGRRLGLDVQICEGINEVEFAGWQGRTFEDLDGESTWSRFNWFRSGTRPPGGELMLQVQARMVATLEALQTEFPDDVIALVGHGDPIKTAIACCAGIPLDLMLRIEISPASISVITIDEYGPGVLCVNNTAELPYHQ